MNLDSKKDEIIGRKMKEQAANIPESFQKNIRTFIRELPSEQKAEKRKYPMYKVAAIFFVACLLCSGTCYAGVKLYQQRLLGITKTEREKINDNIQKSDADADAYSRSLTETENNMFVKLREEYENGEFPEGQLLTVEKIADVPEDTLLYCYENSTFYLPEKELSKQQMLEMIDFRYKRDYAVAEENQEKLSTSRPLNNDTEKQKLWESRTKDFVECMLGLSVDHIKFSAPKVADGDEEKIEMTCSSRDWEYSYEFRMDAQTGEISDMGLDIDVEPYLKSGISINEQLYQSRSKDIKKNVEALYHKEIKRLTLYYNYADGKLSRGNTKYAVCLNDDTTIVLMYSEALNSIYSLYVTDYDNFKSYQNDSSRAAKMRGYKVKKVKLL